MAIPMGLNQLGNNPDLVIKRKFRWTFEATVCGGSTIPPYYLKSAARPEVSLDETQLDFLNGRMWIPGKATWAELPVVFLDVAAPDFAPLWGWLSSVYEFDNPISLRMNTKPREYQGIAYITLYDGCGNIVEMWILNNCWPKSYKFGDLAYESSEVCTIDVSLRYFNVQYINVCGPQPQRCNCSRC
jgi:hypothetical protein